MKAIQIHSTGGPEVLQLDDLPIPQPGPGQVLIRIEATGVNFIEIYFRKGVYKTSLPMTPGSEAAGTVEEVGPGVTGFAAGDAVASTSVIGSYAEYALVPAAQLVKVPDGLSLECAAAAMLQGMTAHYLAYSTFPLKKGDTALVHAGAGGVGLLLTQIATAQGARVITTVSTKAKAGLSREAGASDVILYENQDFEAEVKRLTEGKGVDVVYDSVGKTTFEKSLNCLRPEACWRSSAHRAAPFRHSIPSSSIAKDRSISLGPRSGTTSPRAPNSSGAPATFSAGQPRASSSCVRSIPIRWPTRPRLKSTSNRAKPPEKSCSCRKNSF